jgi:hypothetical protein
MNKEELRMILEKDEVTTISHACSDLKGKSYTWIPRTTYPKSCPRCKKRLDLSWGD